MDENFDFSMIDKPDAQQMMAYRKRMIRECDLIGNVKDGQRHRLALSKIRAHLRSLG